MITDETSLRRCVSLWPKPRGGGPPGLGGLGGLGGRPAVTIDKCRLAQRDARVPDRSSASQAVGLCRPPFARTRGISQEWRAVAARIYSQRPEAPSSLSGPSDATVASI